MAFQRRRGLKSPERQSFDISNQQLSNGSVVYSEIDNSRENHAVFSPRVFVLEKQKQVAAESIVIGLNASASPDSGRKKTAVTKSGGFFKLFVCST